MEGRERERETGWGGWQLEGWGQVAKEDYQEEAGKADRGWRER